MIEIWLNGVQADVSDSTAIGLNKKPFDITAVPQTSVTFSNSFKIPKTPTNRKIFEFCDLAGANSDIPYESLVCKIVDGFEISNGRAILGTVDDNYNLTFFEDALSGGVATLRGTKLDDYVFDKIKNGVTFSTSTDLSTALDVLIAGTDGFKLPWQLQYTDYASNLMMLSEEDASGNHSHDARLWHNVETILSEFLLDNGYDFTDNTGEEMYFPVNKARVEYTSNFPTIPLVGNFKIKAWYADGITETYTAGIRRDFTMMDLLIAYAQKTNSFIDFDEKDYIVGPFEKRKKITLTPFSQLYSTKDTSLNDKLVSWSKKFVSSYAKTNIISFTNADEASDNDMSFDVNNENISDSADYLSINLLNPLYKEIEDWELFDYYFDYPLEEFPLMEIDTSEMSDSLNIEMTAKFFGTLTTVTASKTLPKLAWPDTSSAYTDMESKIFDNYEAFDAEVYINSLDYINIDTSKKYFFEQLGGYFIINKIAGYNPSNEGTTKLELIRIR